MYVTPVFCQYCCSHFVWPRYSAVQHLFIYGIDPLLIYLENRFQGILILSTPSNFLAPPLCPFEERYKVIGYADDVKPAITTMEEFKLVDKAMAAGCTGILLVRSANSYHWLGGVAHCSKRIYPVGTWPYQIIWRCWG